MTLQQVEPKKIYIWVEESWRQPWANTVLYMPFKTDLLDHSGSNYSLTQTWTVSISGWFAYFNGWYLYNNTDKVLQQMPATVSVRVNLDSVSGNDEQCIVNSNRYSWGFNGWNLIRDFNQKKLRSEVLPWWSVYQSVTTSANTRYLMTLTMESWTSTFYINWASQNTSWCNVTMQTRFAIGTSNWADNDLWQYLFRWYMSDLIIEDKARTAGEVSTYFDLTKWNYWIS